jgi:hypothetical protein
MSNAVEQFAVLKFRWFLVNARLQSDAVDSVQSLRKSYYQYPSPHLPTIP